MRLFVAGGCGDEGRNCFLVEGERHTFLMDAGTSTDGLDRLPDLKEEEIQRLEYIFITHSHRDHTGALEYLVQSGFRGSVLMSRQTYRQIHYKPQNTIIFDSSSQKMDLEPGFTVRWGRTGHCAGALWFHILAEGKHIFFSGDYREEDPFYRCDPVRGIHVDMAVIDGAYSRKDRGIDLRRQVAEEAAALLGRGGALLLPVPHYGRGLSMAVLFHHLFGKGHPLFMSSKLHNEWMKLGHRKYFACDQAVEIPFSSFLPWDNETIERGGIYFLTDVQLSHKSSRELIAKYSDMGVLLTGSVHGYGRAGEFLKFGRARLSLWPNHQTWREMEELQAVNDMPLVLPFHNRNVPAASRNFYF